MTKRVTTPFDRNTTAQEVLADVDLSGKRAIVTGGSSGIGVETVRALAHAGAEVTIGVRDVEAGGVAARDILMSSGNDIVQVARLDLDRRRVDPQRSPPPGSGPLDILVNNAGVMAIPELELSFEGHEKQFATNHLGHFALTVAMHQALAAANGARVVCVSSSAHFLSPVVFADVDFENREYDPWLAYGQSKTANVLHAVEISRRWADEGIVANALNPGAIPTRLQRYTGGLQTPENLAKDGRTRSGHLGATRGITPGRGHRGALLRGLQRGRGHDGPRTVRRWRQPLGARSLQRSGTVGPLTLDAGQQLEPGRQRVR